MNFQRRVQRVSRRQYRRGRLSLDDYQKVQKALQDPERMAQWEAEVVRQLRPARDQERERRINWAALRQWFIENWPTILKIFLSLLILLDNAPVLSEANEPLESEEVDDFDSNWEDADNEN